MGSRVGTAVGWSAGVEAGETADSSVGTAVGPEAGVKAMAVVGSNVGMTAGLGFAIAAAVPEAVGCVAVVMAGADGVATPAAGVSVGGGLTRVCKIEIIATNRPHRPWIPAYAGMTEWAW